MRPCRLLEFLPCHSRAKPRIPAPSWPLPRRGRAPGAVTETSARIFHARFTIPPNALLSSSREEVAGVEGPRISFPALSPIFLALHSRTPDLAPRTLGGQGVKYVLEPIG